MPITTTLSTVTDDSLAATLAPGSGLVAVEFSAEWCGPCRVLAPIVENLATEYSAHLRFVTMDGDRNPLTMARYGVRGLPTILLFRDGELVDRILGAMPKSVLRDRLARHFTS